MDTITLLSQFAIVGVLVSLVIEYTKNFLTKATPGARTAYMIILSLIGGLIIYFWNLVPVNFVTAAVGVIAAVNTAYVFLVQYLPNLNPTITVSQ